MVVANIHKHVQEQIGSGSVYQKRCLIPLVARAMATPHTCFDRRQTVSSCSRCALKMDRVFYVDENRRRNNYRQIIRDAQ